MKKNAETLLTTCMEVGTEVNIKKTEYTVMYYHNNAGQYCNARIKIANKFFEIVAKFKS
jgi:hypothetical protein